MSIEIDLNALPSSFDISLNEINTINKAPIEKKEQTETETPNTFSYSEIDIKDASSSIYFTQGETKLLVAIYGPKETKFRDKVKNEAANIEIYTKFYKEMNKDNSANINSSIKQFVKSIVLASSYPKCQINVNVNVLSANEDDFILLSVIYNGILLAMCLSGIDMKAMALTKGFHSDGKSLIVSLDANDDSQLLYVDSNIPLKMEDYEQFVEYTKKSNEAMYKRIKMILYKKLQLN